MEASQKIENELDDSYLYDLLSRSSLFATLDHRDKVFLARQLESLGFHAGDNIVEQGAASDGIYLIESGRVLILDKTGQGKPVVLQTLSVDDTFGEHSLLNRTTASATVQAAESTRVYRLPPDAVNSLLAGSSAIAAQLHERIAKNAEFNFLRRLKLLSELSRREIETILGVITTISLSPGEYLFREDDIADAAYIIKQGSIRVIKESAANAELAVRGAGELLGEAALQTALPRSAAAVAIDQATLLRLSAEDCGRVLGQSPVRESIAREVDVRALAHETAIYNSDTTAGRAALLKLLHGEGGVSGLELFWQRAKQEKQSYEESLKSLSRATGLGYMAPSSHMLVDPELVKRIPPHYAQANQVLPVFANPDSVEVLTVTPFLGTVTEELGQMLQLPVVLRLTEPAFLTKLIEVSTAPGEGVAGSLSDLAGADNWDELDSIEDLKDQAQAAPIIKLVNNIFMEAIGRKASDIHVDPYENEMEVRYRIDGILQDFTTAPRRYQAAIISRIKIMANLDISERRIPQDGRISLRLESKNFDIRVATIPTVFGEGVVMRILDKSSVQVQLTDVGFAPAMFEQWKESITQPNGVVLVTGPTGSGKTTTLYATLNHVKNAETKIITAEDPVEYQLHGIKQVQIDAKVNLTFAAALRSMLRLDPDIIMVGEVRDLETAEIAIQAALTGHLVFSTLHTNDAPTAVTRLVEMGIQPYLVASAVTAVLAQRLVRKLCMNCRVQTEDGKWQPVGCNQCDGSGYKGRLGIYELMVLNDAIRELVIENKDATVIAAVAREHGLITLTEDGYEKIQQGLTSEEEVRRVAGT
jgi:general secretion pathway protein E